MGKRKFKVGDRVRVKDINFKGEDAEDANAVRGKIGTVIEVDSSYCYPYTISFEGPYLDMCFEASKLEKVK